MSGSLRSDTVPGLLKGSVAGMPLTHDTPGADVNTSTMLLEKVATPLQSYAPIQEIKGHVCTWAQYHHDPQRAIETHHHVARLNEEVFQCPVYSSEEKDAKLIGVEYIVSERLFETLPDDEKKLWHSHFYEIKTGLWIMPGIPGPIERTELSKMATTYGKFWGTWQCDSPQYALPLGPPALMTSPQAEASVPPNMVTDRDTRYAISSKQEEVNREEIVGPAKGIHKLSDIWKYGKGWATEVQERDNFHFISPKA